MAWKWRSVPGFLGTAAALATASSIPGCLSGAGRSEVRPAVGGSPTDSRARLRGIGVVMGRLVRGCGANPVEGQVAISLPGEGSRVASTFGRGAFRFEGLPDDGSFTLTADSNRLLPAVLPHLRVPTSGILDLGDIELGSGAKVEVQARLPEMDPLSGLGALRTTTDSEGRYSLDGLPANSLTIFVRRSPSSIQRVAEAFLPNLKVLDILLVAGVQERGRVVDAALGTPIAGADVEAEAWGGYPGSSSTYARATTDSDGTFCIESLGPGKLFDLTVRKEGYA